MNKAIQYALLIGLFCSATSALAVDTLDVGQDGRLGRWDSIVEEAKFLGVARDSIWMWPAEAGENLSLRLAERGGMAVGLVANPNGILPVPIGTLLYDGNSATAFDPDQFAAIDRNTPVEIDLGATFRVNRIRLFPRLDRQNRRRFLQVFRLYTKAERQAEYDPAVSYLPSTPNVEPVVERRIDSRDVRYVRIEPSTEREWELAEVEIYAASDAPVGTYVSRPVRTRYPNIVWGKVRYEGGSIENAPASVQTRTGSDRDPEHYFRIDLQAEDGLQRVSKEDYQALPNEEKGPIRPNPLWSSWQTVSGGLIHSQGCAASCSSRCAWPHQEPCSGGWFSNLRDRRWSVACWPRLAPASCSRASRRALPCPWKCACAPKRAETRKLRASASCRCARLRR